MSNSSVSIEFSESCDNIHIVLPKCNIKEINNLKLELEAKNKEIAELKKRLSYSSNISGMEFAAPHLLNVLKADCNGNGYQVELKFSASIENKSEFILKYINIPDNDNKNDDVDDIDDNKKNEEEKWMETSIGIKPVNDNKFLSAISKVFEFNRRYLFKIITEITSPISMKCKSNVISIMVSDKIDRSKERKIPLQIHAHNGHWENNDTYSPQHILSSNTCYYGSTQNVVKNDWIIFVITEDECIYIPTKIQVVGYNEGISLKDFKLSIGDQEEKKWISCDENSFTATKQTEIQTFTINIGGNPVNICEITKNCYKHLKLEILNNYGDNRYVGLKEFIVYGVKSELMMNKEIIPFNNMC